MNTNKKARMFIHCCIGITVLYVPGAMAQASKVDVCHIPPGNPDNVHTITISENALAVHLDHGDNIGACDSEMNIALRAKAAPAPAPVLAPASAACACPKAGVWRATNLDGWMECNALNLKRPLRGKARNDGAIWILNDDCSTTFLQAYEKDHENVIMHRGRDCMYFGFAPGEEDGAEVLFDGAYIVETEKHIAGEFFLEMSGDGINCSGYRPFEMDFLEPLDEKKYDKLEAKMQETLKEAREIREEHREQIEEYLEETYGGMALGGAGTHRIKLISPT